MPLSLVVSGPLRLIASWPRGSSVHTKTNSRLSRGINKLFIIPFDFDRESIEALSKACSRVIPAVQQDVDGNAVGKNADEVLNTTAAMLQQAKKQRRGQRALSQSLEYLKAGMKRGFVQDAVKTFGSAEMVELGKRALSSDDQEAKDVLLERVRMASVEFLSHSLPNIQILKNRLVIQKTKKN